MQFILINMIPTENFKENIGKTIVLGRREGEGDNKELAWYSGIIDEVFDDSVFVSEDHDYGIRFTDKRLSGKGDTCCVIGHKSLYDVPVEALTGEMDADALRQHLLMSPDFESPFGSKQDDVEDMISKLDTIVENYQPQEQSD